MALHWYTNETEARGWLGRETIEAIIEMNPPDPTLFKETISIALLSGDIAKVS